MADPNIAAAVTRLQYAQRSITSGQPDRAPSFAAEAQDYIGRFLQGTPQAAALANQNQVYLHGGAANGNPNGVSFTVEQAREWWNQWFANPVFLGDVRPTLLPGSLVLTADELKQAQALQAAGNTLPVAPEDYNPLNLPVIA